MGVTERNALVHAIVALQRSLPTRVWETLAAGEVNRLSPSFYKMLLTLTAGALPGSMMKLRADKVGKVEKVWLSNALSLMGL